MNKSDIANCCGDFAESYEQSRLPVMREIEREVLGCDYGGTSWTTLTQAERIAEALDLRQGVQHLDVGSGSGWPALHLAGITGCDVTLVDVPMIALRLANERAEEDDLTQKCRVVAASGAALPFADACFDSLSHSDVLCCLPEKLSMLRECRRVARSEAGMLFSVIAITPGLAEAEYARAVEAGPPFVEVPSDYEQLIQSAGWFVVEQRDVTAEYARSLRVLVENMTRRKAEIAEAIGIENLQEQTRSRKDQISAIERRLLKREIFLCHATSGPGN